jgi:hypothetical protein
MRNLIIAFLIVIIAQVIAYFQLQSQFFWTWSKNHPIILSLLGIPISWLLILFTKYCALGFHGETWPGRLIGFASGAIVFAILSHLMLKEPFTPKTIACLSLALLILLIQIIWK